MAREHCHIPGLLMSTMKCFMSVLETILVPGVYLSGK